MAILNRMADFEDRIRLAASRVGSLNKLAFAINVPRRTLGNWLKGSRPKPEALSAIASVANISLDWLVTGEGDPDEDGFSISMRKYERNLSEKRKREKEEDEAFNKGLHQALEQMHSVFLSENKKNQERNPIATSRRSFVPLQRKILANIKKVHSVAGIKLHSEDVSFLAMDLFAELKDRVSNMSDVNEVEIVLAELTHNLAKDLEDANAEPGTNKREAL